MPDVQRGLLLGPRELLGRARRRRTQPGRAEVAPAEDVLNETERHADAGRAKPPVPGRVRIHAPAGDQRAEPLVLDEEPGDDRPEERAEVDAL